MSKIVYTRETTNDDIGTVETFYEAQADELSGETLEPYFDSSESVTKSLNESGNIEFSVNADIAQKVERAILTPVDAPSEDVVPVIDSTNAVSYKPLSEIGGGGGGGGGGGKTLKEITFTNHNDLKTWAFANYTKIYSLSLAMGTLVAAIVTTKTLSFNIETLELDTLGMSKTSTSLDENRISIEDTTIILSSNANVVDKFEARFGTLTGNPITYTVESSQNLNLSDLDAMGNVSYIVEYFE